MKKLTAVVAALSLALSLAACAGGGSDTRSPAQRAIETVDQAYTVAIAGAAVYALLPECSSVEAGSLCSEPAIIEQIAKARAVLDLAVGRARETILAAQDASAMQIGIRVALDAVAVYAKVIAAYGIKSD